MLAKDAASSDPQVFIESIFPKAFGDAAQDSYMETEQKTCPRFGKQVLFVSGFYCQRRKNAEQAFKECD